MAHQFTMSYLKDSIDLFRYYKKLGERAMAQCPDERLFTILDAESNSIAIVVKHMAGNMRSRWTDFLPAMEKSRTATAIQNLTIRRRRARN